MFALVRVQAPVRVGIEVRRIVFVEALHGDEESFGLSTMALTSVDESDECNDQGAVDLLESGRATLGECLCGSGTGLLYHLISIHPLQHSCPT